MLNLHVFLNFFTPIISQKHNYNNTKILKIKINVNQKLTVCIKCIEIKQQFLKFILTIPKINIKYNGTSAVMIL